MSPLLAGTVLAGIAGVPAFLLWAGRRFREFTPGRLGAYRGAVVGYLVSGVAVVVAVLAPPHVWPPPDGAVRILLVTGPVAGPALGSLLGFLRVRHRR